MLKIEHLTKTYGGKPAVQDLCLHIRPGELCAFIGHNGAGKTTTLKCCCGIQQFDAGEIYVDGISVRENPLECKRRLAYLPDDPQLYDYMTGIQYLDFIADIFGVSAAQRTQRIRQYGDAFGLTPDLAQSIGAYSHGMKQKLAIISALIHKPRLLVLDEPNSGLDPRSRKDFQLLLQRLAREDYTILISSHILSELADLCTSIGVINGGVMVQQGKLENIMLAIDSSNPLRITVLNQVPKALELLRQDPQVSRLSVDENKIAAWFSGSREEEAYLLQKLVDAGILVVSFAREHNSLESLFFHLTGETEQKSRNTETFGNTIG